MGVGAAGGERFDIWVVCPLHRLHRVCPVLQDEKFARTIGNSPLLELSVHHTYGLLQHLCSVQESQKDTGEFHVFTTYIQTCSSCTTTHVQTCSLSTCTAAWQRSGHFSSGRGSQTADWNNGNASVPQLLHAVAFEKLSRLLKQDLALFILSFKHICCLQMSLSTICMTRLDIY